MTHPATERIMTITPCRAYPATVRFSRKPTRLRAILREHSGYCIEEELVTVIAVNTMTAAEYDGFVCDLRRTQEWIASFKGRDNQCIAVHASDRLTFISDPKLTTTRATSASPTPTEAEQR